ncbi:hypothetical protein TNCV_1271051 [Trichonephila clavipes]|nr:hypothetical protein TNCV_1271051 [Trichonephila clavipes]
MPTFKITRQDGNPNFTCVGCVQLATMCFVPINVANTVAIVHDCKLSQKNIATIASSGTFAKEDCFCLIRRLINNRWTQLSRKL